MSAFIMGCATGYATGCPPMASAAQRAASLFPNLMMPAWILPSVTSSTIRLDSAHAATISAATLRLCS